MSDLKLQEFLSNVSEPTQLVQYNTSSFLDNCRTADKAVRTISLVLFHGHALSDTVTPNPRRSVNISTADLHAPCKFYVRRS